MGRPDGGYGRDPSIPETIGLTIASLLAIALYNVVELNVIIFTTFKRIKSLYPWSLLASTWGVALWSLGFLLKSFRLTDGTILYSIFIAAGWCAMVTGQSMVLYSRLHFVLFNRTPLRVILGMIIFNAITMHIPTIVMGFGANSDDPGLWLKLYPIYEKVNVTVFFLQEFVISTTYVVCTIKWLKGDIAVLRRQTKLLRYLALVNCLVIILDVAILALEYAGLYDVQTAYKGMAYSIKLKLEFRILNDLVKFTTSRSDRSIFQSNTNHSSGAEPSELLGAEITPYSSSSRAWTRPDNGPRVWVDHNNRDNIRSKSLSTTAITQGLSRTNTMTDADGAGLGTFSREDRH